MLQHGFKMNGKNLPAGKLVRSEIVGVSVCLYVSLHLCQSLSNVMYISLTI